MDKFLLHLQQVFVLDDLGLRAASVLRGKPGGPETLEPLKTDFGCNQIEFLPFQVPWFFGFQGFYERGVGEESNQGTLNKRNEPNPP